MPLKLAQIIEDKLLHVVFQPIVNLQSAVIMGYELLARGPHNTHLEYPLVLFADAKAQGLLRELDYLCRLTAMEAVAALPPSEHLFFINLHSEILQENKFSDDIAKRFLSQGRVDPEKIVFEITERSVISHPRTFRQAMNNYSRQGFKIAIDDLGSGNAGLSMLITLRPNFVKLARELIHDIHHNGMAQNLIRFLVEFAHVSGMVLIAEGIEKVEEMRTLQELGVPFGQGYLIAYPAASVKQLEETLPEKIRGVFNGNVRRSLRSIASVSAGEVARPDAMEQPNRTCSTIAALFQSSPTLSGLVVGIGNKAKGLVMRDKFMSVWNSQAGRDLFGDRPISELMDRHVLRIERDLSIEETTIMAMGRDDSHLYDYIVVEENEKYYGVLSIRRLLDYTMHLELRRKKYTNPVTGLPCNPVVEHELSAILKSAPDYTVIYADIRNFRLYNDKHGFDQGDLLLCEIARMMREFSESLPTPCFVGQVEADDFVLAFDSVVPRNALQRLSRLSAQLLEPHTRTLNPDALRHNGNGDHPTLLWLELAIVTSKLPDISSYSDLNRALRHLQSHIRKGGLPQDEHQIYFAENTPTTMNRTEARKAVPLRRNVVRAHKKLAPKPESD